MKCNLIATDKIADGNIGYECERCKKLAWIPQDSQGIRDAGDCAAIPRLHEWREWLLVIGETFGLDRAASIVWFIRWRLRGSPLEELPPKVPSPQIALPMVTPSEIAELFPGNEDPSLVGNRIKALIAAIGIPACGGCEARRQWMNKAHEWLRSIASDSDS